MKVFNITTIAAIVLLILTALTIAVLKVEEQRTQIEAQKDTIRELNDELHKTEVMYLKCRGSVQTEQHGAHYVNGKIKFYNFKN